MYSIKRIPSPILSKADEIFHNPFKSWHGKNLAWHKKIIFRISTIVELIKDYFLVIISTLIFQSV